MLVNITKIRDMEAAELLDYDRLEQLIKEKGVTKTHLCAMVGKPNYYLRDAKQNKSAIPIEHIKVWYHPSGYWDCLFAVKRKGRL